MDRPRVAITGWGAICALGSSVPASMAALYAGQIPPPGDGRPPTSLREPPRAFLLPAELERVPVELGPAPLALGPAAGERALSRSSQMALLAAREALGMAADGALETEPGAIGVCLGTTAGCTFNDEPYYRAFRSGQPLDTASIRRYFDNDLSSVVAALARADGPTMTVVNACASGTDAVGLATRWIEAGVCDVALAGGADEVPRFPYLGFSALRNTSMQTCRPFDRHRAGLNLGEGAGVLVLEREALARRRGARVLGWVAGYAATADAHHPTAPHPEGRGLRAAVVRAAADAGVEPRAIEFVNAHGTGTVHNDRAEGRALAELLGEGRTVVGTKGYTGHTMGAAGALEAIFALHNLNDGRVPRTAGFETPDPECVVVPTTETRGLDAQIALSTSLAFGGTNAVLVLRRGDG
jgi:3-oxoacyl-[acyl-carrier-protein] synthase-1/3-oxoacyl-[acyl-carrier-protein] synthase II